MEERIQAPLRPAAFRAAKALLLLIVSTFSVAVFLQQGEIRALAQGRRVRVGPTGALSGTVLGPDGKPVEGARVMAQTSDGRAPRTARTDANGRFHFRGLRVAPYDLRARANGRWSDWTRDVPVRANEEATVKLRIPAAKAAPARTPPPDKSPQKAPALPPQKPQARPGRDAAK
jgi:hypothetical protein